MIKSNFFRFSAILVFGAVMTMMSSCSDDESISNPFDPNADQMQTRVIDVPTAVMSSFDDNSMGAALVRRLSNTTTSVDDNTKMILIKGEDILSRPLTEWQEAAKLYLTGGYIAIEKPHNAHLVHLMEQLSAKFEQAAHEILTKDDGSGITISVIPANTQSKNSINAHAAQFENRIANIKSMAATRSGAGEADAVAEMVIFSRYGFYHCAPFGKNVITVGTKSNGSVPQTITQKHTRYTSGLLADGAAKWINTKNAEQTVTRSSTRADGGGAINEIMSASEEHTYQADLTSMTFNDPSSRGAMDFYTKPGAYTEIYRVWGVNNTETNRDYYFVEQDVTVGMGGKKDGDDKYDRNKTLYHGPYEKDKWIKDVYYGFYKEGVGTEWYDHFYGSWFDYGEFKLSISGNGNIMLQNALPETDNNTTSVSIAVGETHTETNTIGASLGFAGKVLTGGVNYSHGWTDGTSYTMTTTTNSKELKCVKNTSGTQVQWYYSCGTDMEAGDDDEHPLAPDALTNDVNIKNQVCWSVDNPEGAYTIDVYHVRTTAWLSNDDDDDKVKGTCQADNEQEEGMNFTMLVPNRSKQTWYMDVTFPEIDDPNYAGVKTQLITALQNQFPDIYQTSMDLADQTPESENTIKIVVDSSRKMLENPNAMQTLIEYGKTYQLSEYTIKWYNTMVDENNDPIHESYEMIVHVK